MVPVTSAGIRSGVNWIREYSRPVTLASVLTRRVLPRPGAPSISAWPPLISAIRSCSMASSWPTTTEAISRLVAARSPRSDSRVATSSVVGLCSSTSSSPLPSASTSCRPSSLDRALGGQEVGRGHVTVLVGKMARADAWQRRGLPVAHHDHPVLRRYRVGSVRGDLQVDAPPVLRFVVLHRHGLGLARPCDRRGVAEELLATPTGQFAGSRRRVL